MELYINKFLNEKRVAFRSYKICLVIDSYGWAHNIMAINIKKAMESNHLLFIYTTQELIDNILNNDFDIKIIDMFFLLNSYDPNILSGNITLNSLLPKEKVVHWICDYSSWINHPDDNIMINGRKMLLDTLNNSSITLCMCDKIKEYLNEINIYPKNILDFEYLIDFNKFIYHHYDYDSIMNKDKLNIGWAGTASPHCHGWLKGLDNIKNVISKNSDKFNLIYYNKFEDKYLNYDDMPYFYRDIDIYICFSKYEGGPQTIYEASSSGRAWISTDVGNISKMINFNNNCGIIINRSEEDLEKALLDLYNNRDKIIELGKNARNVIENNFNYINITNNCFNKIFDILY
jgi:glycosyltransferase involved in cell wall biosynthesis